MLVPQERQQQNLDPPRRFEHKGFTFATRARYDITARLLRKEIYHLDGGAGLAPVDLGVGWGPLSDSTLLKELEFSQMGRFFYWQPRKAGFPVPIPVLISHLAQMHMIPATKEL